jgi:hypothetical protein
MAVKARHKATGIEISRIAQRVKRRRPGGRRQKTAINPEAPRLKTVRSNRNPIAKLSSVLKGLATMLSLFISARTARVSPLTAKKPSNKGASHMLCPGNAQGMMARNTPENPVNQVLVKLVNQIPAKTCDLGHEYPVSSIRFLQE